MDINIALLSGRLAAPPEIRAFDGGTRLVRYLVTVRSTDPASRVDVVPVTHWDPSDDLLAADPPPGHRVWVAGSVQRRFWDGSDGRRSRIEVVAPRVRLGEVADAEPFVSNAEEASG